MGQIKQKFLEMEEKLSGSEPSPAIEGGYLYIYKGDELLGIVSIPSPNLLAENYRDSMVVYDDIVTDSEGNEYSVEVTSSLYGIDWRIYEYPDDKDILNQIRVEVKYNEY
jgi:hypothetical protein